MDKPYFVLSIHQLWDEQLDRFYFLPITNDTVVDILLHPFRMKNKYINSAYEGAYKFCSLDVSVAINNVFFFPFFPSYLTLHENQDFLMMV